MKLLAAFIGPLLAVAPLTAMVAQEDSMDSDMKISSPAFSHNHPIPVRFTADGANVSPQLDFAHPPQGTVSFALIMDDPDAPRGTWVHWVVWNIPAATGTSPEGGLPEGAVQGRNSWGRSDYGGPSPPSGTHRYYFKLYALDTILDLPTDTGKAELLMAMEAHVLGRAEVMGTYAR